MSAVFNVIKICADDFGLSAGIDEGIFDLLSRRRITSTSCMTGSPRWLNHSAPALKELELPFECGLHFNLTESFQSKQPAMSLREIIFKSYSGQLSKPKIQESLQRQLDDFENGMSRIPDFIDGHQHVHQFPRIRDVVIDTLLKRYPDKPYWVRHTVPPKSLRRGKPLVLFALGGRAFLNQLHKHRIHTNEDFLGVYDFTGEYSNVFAKWLQQAKNQSLIMCHPSARSDDHDGIGEQRVREYAFFSSDDFLALLQMHQFKLA